MAKMTEFQTKLYEKYVNAFQSGNWDYPDKVQGDRQFIIDELKEGKTFFGVWDVIQQKNCRIPQLLMASPAVLNNPTNGYTKRMKKGFQALMSLLGVE